MRVLLIVLAGLVVIAAASSYFLTRPVVSGVSEATALASLEVAPRERALTLARHRSGAVLVVTGVNEAGVSASDVSAAANAEFEDALHAYTVLGLTGLEAVLDAFPPQRIVWEELVTPLGGHYPHIAAGTNYSAHAKEVGHEGEPFLFPKLSHATAWNSAVHTAVRLDYEVELCALPLQKHSEAAPSALGYLLCGDYTDRWMLVKHIDLGAEMGPTGFPIAKGGESRLPIGPLLVIPRDEGFYSELELSLYVNGVLRQKANAGSMLWPPREILARALADCQTNYQLEQETIKIGACDQIPAGTLILTGTPEGVLFHPATLWNPWAYLQAGDVVTSFGQYLGYMRNSVVAN